MCDFLTSLNFYLSNKFDGVTKMTEQVEHDKLLITISN